MTALAARLVEVAANALRDAHFVDPDDDTLPRFHETDQHPEGNIQHWTKPESAARPVVVAVLMELAKSGQVAWAESLAGLASVIEKGEHP